MTTVRFLMRWFRDRPTQKKFRAVTARAVAIKTQPIPVLKPKPVELQIKWGNPVRWHI